MDKVLRKHISISEKDYQTILDFALKNGFSFSEVLRKGALKLIRSEEEISLAKFLNENLEYVSKEEQADIDKLNIDFNDLSGEELSIDDFL